MSAEQNLLGKYREKDMRVVLPYRNEVTWPKLNHWCA